MLFDHHHQCNPVHSLHKITRNILMMMIQLVIQTKQNGRIVCVFFGYEIPNTHIHLSCQESVINIENSVIFFLLYFILWFMIDQNITSIIPFYIIWTKQNEWKSFINNNNNNFCSILIGVAFSSAYLILLSFILYHNIIIMM